MPLHVIQSCQKPSSFAGLEDYLILYNIGSHLVNYLLLVVAYPQPKLVESDSTSIMGIHSSNLFRINQQKGWPQL